MKTQQQQQQQQQKKQIEKKKTSSMHHNNNNISTKSTSNKQQQQQQQPQRIKSTKSISPNKSTLQKKTLKNFYNKHIQIVENKKPPEYIVCNLCHNTTDKETLTLLTFPCEHQICGICLSRILISSDFTLLSIDGPITITCPSCKQHTNTTNTTANPSQKVLTWDELESAITNSTHLRKKHVRENCEQHNKESEGYCKDCKKWYCKLCINEFHESIFATDHLMLPFKPFKHAGCALHNNRMKDLYCLTCNKDICSMCITINEAHNTHKCISLNEFKHKTLSEKKAFVYRTYEQFCTNITSIEAVFRKQFNDTYDKHQLHFDTIIKAMEDIKHKYIQRKKRYLQFIKNMFQTIRMCYSNFYSDLNMKEQTLVRTLKFVQSVNKEINDVMFNTAYVNDLERVSKELMVFDVEKMFQYDIKFVYHDLRVDKEVKDKCQVYAVVEMERGDVVTGGDDNKIKVWDVLNGDVKMEIHGHSETVYTLCYVKERKWLISGGGDCVVKIWDVESINKEKANAQVEEEEKGNEDGDEQQQQRLCTIVHYESGKEAPMIVRSKCYKMLYGHSNTINNIIMLQHSSSNNDRICSCSNDSLILIWSLTNFTCVQKLEGHTKSVGCVLSISPSLLISGGIDKNIFIWQYNPESSSFTNTNVLSGHTNSIFSLENVNNNKILSGSCDRTIRLWSIPENKCDFIFKGHSGYIWKVLSLTDPTKFLSAGSDLTIRLWDITEKKCLNVVLAHDADVTCLLSLTDGNVVSGSADKTLKLWCI